MLTNMRSKVRSFDICLKKSKTCGMATLDRRKSPNTEMNLLLMINDVRTVPLTEPDKPPDKSSPTKSTVRCMKTLPSSTEPNGRAQLFLSRRKTAPSDFVSNIINEMQQRLEIHTLFSKWTTVSTFLEKQGSSQHEMLAQTT